MKLPFKRPSKTILRLCAAALVAVSMSAVKASAEGGGGVQQASPILTIDSNKLFDDSDYGRQTIEALEARGARLAAENRRIEAELEAEEKELTELRPTMEPAEFRQLADDFDTRVQEIRRTQESKGRALNTELEERRIVFLNSAVPVLEQLMRETGAVVVLEMRTVFISSNAIDVTPIAIERLNRVLSRSDEPVTPSD